MKLLGPVAVGALVVGVVLTGWARSAGREAETKPAPPTEPAQSTPAAPPTPIAPRIKADLPGPAGLDVRYLDADGEVKRLGVKDFPR